jgi:cell wall assembly regulator SMI1
VKSWHKVIIGITIALALVAGSGLWGLHRFRTFLYPPAPPMPAVVGDPMSQILAHLEAILKTNAPQVLAELQPGLSVEQIAKLETQYHIQVPEEIKAIYEWHNGSARLAATNRLSEFIPLYRFLPLDEALADRAMTAPEQAPFIQRTFYRLFAGHRDSWVCLFDDGAGDGYWFDPNRKPSEGAVFYNFTEEASYIFFPSPKNLMAGVAECYAQGAFHLKKDSSPPGLEEDFERTQQIWGRFGASK